MHRAAKPAAHGSLTPLSLALALASLGCLSMVALRVAVTGSIRYVFLVWNLFLAWIPYALALAVRRIVGGTGAGLGASAGALAAAPASARKPLALLLAIAWLFFYPNAPYILTDFIHLIRTPVRTEPRIAFITANALLWYDIILHSCFAFIGHIIGLISLLLLHGIIRRRYGRRWGWAFVAIATVLGGYGIYIGRFERLNSWDIARDPLLTLRTVFVNLVNLKAVLVSLCFALFIFITYVAVAALYHTARHEQAREGLAEPGCGQPPDRGSRLLSGSQPKRR